VTIAADGTQTADGPVQAAPATLERGIDWTGAFWVASGVPPLVLFSIGSVAATVGKLSWIVWTASIAMGFIQSFTYAEIAGLFPNKSGGASVYGAIAWVRYSKLVAPVSVWCNWFAWSPVQATRTSVGCTKSARTHSNHRCRSISSAPPGWPPRCCRECWSASVAI